MEELKLSLRKTLPDMPAVVGLEGYLDSSTSYKLNELVDALFAEGYYKFVFNLEKLEYLSSAGISVMSETLDKVREKEGDLKLAGASQRVIKVVDLTGLTKLLKNYTTEVQAVESFRAGSKQEGGFPRDISCVKCNFTSVVPNSDIFKCPKCGDIFFVDSFGVVNPVDKVKMDDKLVTKLEMWIKSDISYNSAIRKFVSRIALKEGFSEESAAEIELALDEAVTNIVEHSYDYNPTQNIGITIATDRSRFVITLVDKGKGFNMEKQDVGIDGSSKGPYRGRGIKIMKQIMDEVVYTPVSGVENKLVLTKNKKDGDKGVKEFIRLE